MIFSKPCEYAIRALLYLVSRDHAVIGLRRIAQDLEIPQHFLSKIMQILVKRGFITSIKGPNGGFRMQLDPESINLAAVVEIIDGLNMFERCAIGVKECNDEHPCPIHDRFKSLKDQLEEYLNRETLMSLSQKMTAANSKVTIVPSERTPAQPHPVGT